MKNLKSKKPFFANFLENQFSETEKVNGGNSEKTVLADQTKSSITKPIWDMQQTMKYPSDSDEI